MLTYFFFLWTIIMDGTISSSSLSTIICDIHIRFLSIKKHLLWQILRRVFNQLVKWSINQSIDSTESILNFIFKNEATIFYLSIDLEQDNNS